jgi:hypothetical protein
MSVLKLIFINSRGHLVLKMIREQKQLYLAALLDQLVLLIPMLKHHLSVLFDFEYFDLFVLQMIEEGLSK